LHVPGADVVRAENELDPLRLVGDRVLPGVVERPEIAAGAVDALPWIARVDAELAGRPRHDLHHADRPRPRVRVRVELRLLERLRGDEAPAPARDCRELAKPGVVRRERPRLSREELALRARREAAAVEEVAFVERAEEALLLLGLDKPVQRAEQRG